MRTLFIEDREEVRDWILPVLTKYCANLTTLASPQDAIEALEVRKEKFALVVCDYHGGSIALLKCLVAASSEFPTLLLLEADAAVPDLFLVPRAAILKTLARDSLPLGLETLLEELKNDGLFSDIETKDEDFIRVDAKSLEIREPLHADIYLRLAPNRYCKRFRKEDGFEASDLETHFRKKGLDSIYLHKSQTSALFENQVQSLDRLLAGSDLDPKQARRASSASLEIIHDVVDRLGFTPQVQELTKRTVTLTLKAIGSSPKLSPILTRLQRQEGKYISSHSVMLAEVACAIAHRIGWSSSQVFLKLTLAAFMHDLALTDNRLAQFRTLAELEESDFDAKKTQEFKLHPIKAAEYVRLFDGIPPDVDTIVLQHHEMPDGSGFPRGLFHHQMSTIACIFSVAHDLLHFFLDHVPTNDRVDMLPNFLRVNLGKYADGPFGKIRESLETGEALTL